MINRYVLMDFIAVEVARLYGSKYEKTFHVVVGNQPDFDLISEDESISVEVKVETSPSRTGNACIEYWNTSLDRPSGILRTKATIWLHIALVDGRLKAFEFDPMVLRKLIIERGSVRTTDNAKLKIIPLAEFEKHSRRFFHFETLFFAEVCSTSGIVAASLDFTDHITS